jgi:hypothetical protein
VAVQQVQHAFALFSGMFFQGCAIESIFADWIGMALYCTQLTAFGIQAAVLRTFQGSIAIMRCGY